MELQTSFPVKKLLGCTFVILVADQYGEGGEITFSGTIFIPDPVLTDRFINLLKDIFYYEEFPSYEDFLEDHLESDIETLDNYLPISVEDLIRKNAQDNTTVKLLYGFSMDETGRMLEITLQ